MDYNYGYNYGYNHGLYALQTSAIFSIVGLIAGLICAFVVYFVFLKKRNDGKFKGFAGWMYNFLNFNKLTIEAVIKICYIFLAVWVTISSFGLISTSFVAFLMTFIFGNLFIRIAHELIMISIKICRNTIEINKKMNFFIDNSSEKDQEVKVEATEPEIVSEDDTKENIVKEVANDDSKKFTEKVCPNCGAKVADDMAFCGKCGTKL